MPDVADKNADRYIAQAYGGYERLLLAEIDETTGGALSMERVEVQGDNADQAYDADDKSPNNARPE